MITDEVYVEIEILRKHGMSLREIAEAVGCAQLHDHYNESRV